MAGVGRRFSVRVARYSRSLAAAITLTLALFVVLNLAAAVLLRIDGGPKPQRQFNRALRLAYPDLTDTQREQLAKESHHRFAPSIFAQPREREMAGEFVRIDGAGFRHGSHQRRWPPDPDDLTIFVFGGSTTLGYGVRDEDTVSSYLQELLASQVPRARVAVYNLARGGFYSTQERVLFDELLTLGHVPDIAVFIDGLNEFSLVDEPPPFTSYMTSAAREDVARPFAALVRSLPLAQLVLPSSHQTRFADYIKTNLDHVQRSSEASLVDDLIDRYRANTRIIQALGDAYGVSVAFVWQPIPVYGYDLKFHAAWKGIIGSRHRRGYERLRDELEDPNSDGNPDVIWCADIQQGRQEALYVDQVHYNPQMSRLLARCVVDGLRSEGLLSSERREKSPALVRLMGTTCPGRYANQNGSLACE